jgi:hypothetical protein
MPGTGTGTHRAPERLDWLVDRFMALEATRAFEPLVALSAFKGALVGVRATVAVTFIPRSWCG